ASVVPRSMSAAGVSGSRPWAISSRAIGPRFPSPMRMTSVSTPRASRLQSTRDAPPASWCPVTTANEDATPRCVKGMPAAAGTAALEPHDAVTGERLGDQQRVDLVLGERVRPARLAGEHATGRGRRLVEELRIDQSIVDDDLGAPQKVEAAHGDESGIARPRP